MFKINNIWRCKYDILKPNKTAKRGLTDEEDWNSEIIIERIKYEYYARVPFDVFKRGKELIVLKKDTNEILYRGSDYKYIRFSFKSFVKIKSEEINLLKYNCNIKGIKLLFYFTFSPKSADELYKIYDLFQ